MKEKIAIGAALVLVFTGLNACADAITKHFSHGFEAPQLLALSSAMIVMFSFAMPRLSSRRASQSAGEVDHRDDMVRLNVARRNMLNMGGRSILTVLASFGFYNALRILPLADLFLFVAFMPILAAVLSGPMLGERPGSHVWLALCIGILGLFCLFPNATSGPVSLSFERYAGFGWAALGSVTGTVSMLLGRRIAMSERIPMAQVFWPNLAVMVSMGLILPFVWHPMGFVDTLWLIGYAMTLFGARYLMAEAMRLLPAYIVSLMMNIQFVWMTMLGLLFFGDIPAPGTLLGAGMIILSGFWLIFYERGAIKTSTSSDVVPAE